MYILATIDFVVERKNHQHPVLQIIQSQGTSLKLDMMALVGMRQGLLVSERWMTFRI